MPISKKVAIAKIMLDLIKSDNIIDEKEIEKYEELKEKYKIKQKHISDSFTIDFGTAIETLKNELDQKKLVKQDLQKLKEELIELSLSDGFCAPEEALLIIAIEYFLNVKDDHKKQITSHIISTSITNVTIEKFHIIFLDGYDKESNKSIENSLRAIKNDFCIIGLNFVCLPQIAKDFNNMDVNYLKKVINILDPTICDTSKDNILTKLKTITSKNFYEDILINKMNLTKLRDINEEENPAILLQIAKNNEKTTYLHICLGDNPQKTLEDFVDDYKKLLPNTLISTQHNNHDDKCFIYCGFHKILFNLLAFPGPKKKSEILINLDNKTITLPDIGSELKLTPKQKATYVFILQQSICSKHGEIPINPTNKHKKEELKRTFANIYESMNGKGEEDYVNNLNSTLSIIKSEIRKNTLLDNQEEYIPQKDKYKIKIHLDSKKVFVKENNKRTPLLESSLNKY